MNVILSAVLPVGLIIVIGYIAGQKLNLDQASLCQLSIYILAPAIVADSLYRNTVSGRSVLLIIFGYGLISLVIYGLIWLFALILQVEKDNRQSIFAVILCPNNGNMGLPITTFALGDEGLDRAIIYMIGSSIFLFGMLPAILSNRGWKKGVTLTLKLPLIWAMIFGAMLNFTGVELPFNLGRSMELLGISAIPIALIILGMQLAQSKFVLSGRECLLAVVKLGVAPAIALGIGHIIGLEGIDLKVLVLQTAMPTAVNTLVMVKEFGGNATIVAQTIIISTVMSFITLPLVIWLI
ncbi:AEC family transporter [Cyanobacterium stanieri LEGE 03274]|uniref:AEC family transporter n=1 Tax=Cyanobacterium stanieri LEGE 03274 TaxID=1828756 RepID=A0ABR9V4Z2_9CHRO|nr:AEC family transporter [Cyanobacterium stanieri]MBE9222947.1 AEC family transporter [Cyanobacterium stanieri LEGE 03274]